MTRKQLSPHEAGYRAFQDFGLSARNPYERQERQAAMWRRGFDKARAEARATGATDAE